MRVGILVNESAGAGKTRITEGVRALEEALARERIVARFGCGIEGTDPRSHVEGIRKSVESILGGSAECVICVGGDGFASFCAEALIRAGSQLPILGIGAGTANVGPLIGASLDTLIAARGYAARGYAARGYASRGYAAPRAAAREAAGQGTDLWPLDLASAGRRSVTALECIAGDRSLDSHSMTLSSGILSWER
jgi:hypothetical protein